MAQKSKTPPRRVPGTAESDPTKPPLTVEEYLHRIEAMGKRIDSYIQYICQLTGQSGMSAEVKERAVREFYQEMILVDGQLARIHDLLRLE
jgi:hypothetical protein